MRMKTIFLTAAGFIFLLLGVLGALLPVLPTTPFVLLAAWCFSSVPSLHQKVMKIPFFKEHIENYQNRKGLDRKTLWKSLIWLWGMLVLSMIYSGNLWLVFFLSGIGISVTWHLVYMSRPAYKKEEEEHD